MAQRKFHRLTDSQEEELWRRRHRGETQRSIGKALGMPSGCVYRFVAETGGIKPPPRRRADRTLSLKEREEISRGLAVGASFRAMGRLLGRPASTICREVKRHGGATLYRAEAADSKAWKNARRPKRCRLALTPSLQALVEAKLSLRWSPEQIAGWLKLRFPDDETLQVSHETIYRSLYIQARGVLKKELQKQLRSPRTVRLPKSGAPKVSTRGQIVDAIPISQRPPEVEDRAVPGHWEGDLLAGAKNSHIATLVERKSRFAMLVKVEGKDTKSVVAAVSSKVLELPEALRLSLTWDRGTEMANHKQFTVATNVQVYFCDPRSPWQRGTNENTNRLLRQYFPDGTDLSSISQQELDKVSLELNQRPRETLGFRTPAEALHEAVALTG
jgi:IS30 family transposase